MVSKRRLTSYVNKQLKGMQSILDKVATIQDEKKLHKLRLHGKKVKAIAECLIYCIGNKNKFSTEKLKAVYDKAGEIRTAQLNLQAFGQQAIEHTVFEANQKSIIQKDLSFISSKNRKIKKDVEKLRKKMRQNIIGLKDRDAIGFCFSKIRALSNSFKVIDERRLHKNRKIIKQLLYTLEVLPSALVSKINVNRNYLKKVEELIGDWHDTAVLLECLIDIKNAGKEKISYLASQKQDQLEKIQKETREFDSYVMFAKLIG
jgi:CHAD domain-containing protein